MCVTSVCVCVCVCVCERAREREIVCVLPVHVLHELGVLFVSLLSAL